MIPVGAFEAKTKLSELLDKVEAGEEVTITRHGKAIARIVSQSTTRAPDPDGLVRRMRELASKATIGPFTWKELRDEGRKY